MLCPLPISSLPVRLPLRSLWPERRPLLLHMEQEVIRQLQEVQHSMELMERLHHRIFEELDHLCISSSSSSSSSSFLPISFQHLDSDSSIFGFSLDTAEFSPEELVVTQVGRRLRVSGRSERKQEDGTGSFYKQHEFRQELQLPRGVEPDDVRCSLVDGRLQIQAPRQRALWDGKERIVPITVTPDPPSPACPPTEEPKTDSTSASLKQSAQ